MPDKKNNNKDKLVLALDVETFEEAKKIVDELHDLVGVFKVGKQLFTNVGPKIVEYINSKKAKVFLDLKYHDIPNTVQGASKAAANLGVFMFNVHCAGGSEMMKAAIAGVKSANTGEKAAANKNTASKNGRDPKEKSGKNDVKVLGVTVLTSINENILHDEIHVNNILEDYVAHLALLAKNSGLHGVVASPKEIKLIREECGKDFIILTPGVRPEWAAAGDQKRVMTPKEAIDAGADYIVVGRPILAAKDRKEAAKKILEEIE